MVFPSHALVARFGRPPGFHAWARDQVEALGPDGTGPLTRTYAGVDLVLMFEVVDGERGRKVRLITAVLPDQQERGLELLTKMAAGLRRSRPLEISQ